MKTGIGRWLQIDTGNRPMIIALLVQAGATGLFAATLELTATTLFLDTHEVEKIPLAIMVSGAAGILLAAVYSYFSKQLGIRSFGILNLVAALIITGAVFLGMNTVKDPRFDFVLFIMTGPVLLITLLGFWITVRDFLSPGKSKELSGIIEAALAGGLFIGFAAVPLLVMQGLHVSSVLYPGLGFLVLATGAQLFVLFRMERNEMYPRGRVSSTGPVRLFSHRYTSLIASFAILGVAVWAVLHFSFLWSVSVRYKGGSDLVSFLGFFLAGTVVAGWLMKRFVYGLLKKRFGVGVTLLMAPIFLFIITLVASITGDLYGYVAGSTTIPAFFVLVFMARFIYGAWENSMIAPSMNVLYQTLDPREKNNVKSGIEGVLNQIAVFTIGLFLACFILVTYELLHYTYLLITLIMAWFFVGLTLYRNYMRFLRVSLESDRIRDRADKGLHELAKADLKKTAFPIESIEFNPYLFHYKTTEDLLSMLDHDHPGVRLRIWDYLLGSSPGLPQITLSQMLTSEHEPVIKERIRTLAKRKLRSKLGIQEAFIRERIDRFTEVSTQVDPAIDEAFHSGLKNEVYAALYHVAREHDTTYLPEVVSLLKDKDLDLRSVAITTAGQIDSRRVTSSLMENLDHPVLYARSWSALVRQGDLVLEELEATFHKTSSTVKLQKRIVTIFAAIGSDRALQLLVDKLDYHHREVFRAVVLGLYENHFQANTLQASTVSSAILKLVQTGAWNLAAKISIRMENPGGAMDVAIDHEIWEVNDLILMLLALLYDRKSVHRIRLSLLDKQGEDRGLGMELLDMLLNDTLKSVLISYFSDVLIREKIDKLQSVNRVDILPVNLLLRKILNRDGIQMGDFIRICVLERMGNNERYFDEQQIIAQGFHPNPKIRETAAQLLRKNDPGQYNLVTERLDFPDSVFPGHADSATWNVHTTINLTAWKLFKNVGINSLFRLVSVLQPYDEERLSQGDFVVLARSEETVGLSPLSNGIAIIAAQQPEILEQIGYLGTDGAHEVYMAEREEFIEQLFDDRGLLQVFCTYLSQSAEMTA
jgi:AAA family ATP:ADP antiporter